MAACPHCQLDVLASETVCPRCGSTLVSQPSEAVARLSSPGEEFDVARPRLGGSLRRATYHSPAQGLAAQPGLGDRASAPPPESARRPSPSLAEAPPLDIELLPLPSVDAPVLALDGPPVARAPLASVVDVPDLVVPGAAPAAAARSVRAAAPAKGATRGAGTPAKGTARSAVATPGQGVAKGTPRPAASPVAPPEALTVGAGGPDFDDDFGPSLSLEVDDAPRHKAGKSTRPPALAGGSGLDVALPRAPLGSVPPAGSRAASLPSMADTSDLDPFTVKRLAGFGTPSDSLGGAALYAMRVGWRIGELRQRAHAVRASEVAARHGLDEALVSFLDQRGEELRHEAATAHLFESLTDLQRRRDDWSHSLAEAEERMAARFDEIDRELQKCERAVVDGRTTRDGLADEAARLFESSRAGDAVAGQMLAAVRAQMASADQDATAAIARRTELLRERRSVEEDHDHATRELRQGLAEADAPRRERLLEVGRTALDARLFAGRPGSEALAAAEQKLAAATTERRLLEAALGSYEPPAVKRGALALGAVVLLTIVGVVLGVLRMNRELHAPPPVVPVVR